MILRLTLVVSLLILPAATGAVTYTVNPEGTGDFPTIQAAIDWASAGDVVELEDGTYTGEGNRGIDYCGKDLTVRSHSGDPEGCVVDCEAQARGFRFHSGEGPDSVLEGVTVANGWATGDDEIARSGGGASCRYSSPTISNCVFLDNRAEYCGGGLSLAHEASSSVTDCRFYGNSAPYAGAAFVAADCHALFADTRFCVNSADVHAGAVYCSKTCLVDFTFCTFSGNIAPGAAAVYCVLDCDVVLENCTVTGNVSTGSGGVFHIAEGSLDMANVIVAFNDTPLAPVVCYSLGGATLACCDVYGNEGGDWVQCIEDQLGTSGNISADPWFCSAEPDAEMDWTLSSDSPCVPPQSACGLIGAWDVGCESNAVEETTWGRMKSLYRR